MFAICSFMGFRNIDISVLERAACKNSPSYWTEAELREVHHGIRELLNMYHAQQRADSQVYRANKAIRKLEEKENRLRRRGLL